MRAARLLVGGSSLELVNVAVPEPHGDAVRVRVTGAGVCHSDIHVLDGYFNATVRRPVTMGHEIAGVVDAVGPECASLDIGTPVVVMVGWGCGHCNWCVAGFEQLCPSGDEAGSTADGGFAEYVLVPHRRHVVPIGAIDPLAATPMGCAALSAYAAVKRVLPWTSTGGSVAILGAGGLGTYAVHYAARLTGARVLSVDPNPAARARSRTAGAHTAISSGDHAQEEVRDATGGEGCQAVVDFVGSDESLALAASIVSTKGIVALLGLAGGHLSYGFDTLPPEVTVTTVVAGTIGDLHDVVRLAQEEPFLMPLVTYALEDVEQALFALRTGQIAGRAVLVPN